MRAHERFKGRLQAEEANALRVQAALEDIGYTVGSGNTRQVACIGAIETAFAADPEAAGTALEFCAELYQGAPIRDQVFSGLFNLESYLRKKSAGTIRRNDLKTKLLSVQPSALMEKIHESKSYHGKTGGKVYADGIARFLNKKKSSNRIPSPMAN
jgi:hypothetical protein